MPRPLYVRIVPRCLLALVVATAGTVAPATAAEAAGLPAPVFDDHSPVSRTVGSCVVDVKALTPAAGRGRDDTAAFTSAMDVARSRGPRCYPAGPSGAPQAVVYVPPGTYRVVGLRFPSNLRLEVDAAATLQLPPNRMPDNRRLYAATPMIEWDTKQDGLPALTNVTVTGVGRANTRVKSAAAAEGGTPLASFRLENYFTMNLDPRTTGSTNYNPGLDLGNVRWFRIANVMSLQNATNQRAGSRITPWPTSARAVIQVHARTDSPLRGPFIQPTDGLVTNHVDIDAPRGFGANQINAATRVEFRNVFSLGGTALRFETDGSMLADGRADRGSEVDRVTASNIVGENCNRAVSLAPHAQVNGVVAVHGVWAYACNQAVVASADDGLPAARRGSFASPVVDGVRVQGGTPAQIDSTTMLWAVGLSRHPIHVDALVTWQPRITVVATSGQFTNG